MVTEFKVGRWYNDAGEGVFVVRAIDENCAGAQWEDSGMLGTWPQTFFDGCYELPPLPGEYYEGEDVECSGAICWTKAKYVCHAEDNWHVVRYPGCTRPDLVPGDRIRRPVPKTKTIRRPPTDQDAIDQPRRKCWVRDSESMPWIEGFLLLVSDGSHSYLASVISRRCVEYYEYCEIEVPNE